MNRKASVPEEGCDHPYKKFGYLIGIV